MKNKLFLWREKVEMSKVQMLRASVEQRLTVAVEEILGLFERTIKEYEQENERTYKILDVVLNPKVLLHRADVQQLLVVREEVPNEQQDWSPSLDQEDPEPPHVKEEQEQLWIKQEGEKLQGLEEADITKFPARPVLLKSEDDEESDTNKPKPPASGSTQQMETEADGEDCGGPEPDMNLVHIKDLNRRAASDSVRPSSKKSKRRRISDKKSSLKKHMDTTRDRPSASSTCDSRFSQKVKISPATSCVVDTKVTNTPSNAKNNDVRRKTKRHQCCECGKTFSWRSKLVRHMRVHTGEKPFSCSLCGTTFSCKSNLAVHMRVHTGEKPFSCSVCEKSFSHKNEVRRHMATHTGEKNLVCSLCGIRCLQKSDLNRHMARHTGEKPFRCSVCKKHFADKSYVVKHMMIHIRQKMLSSCVGDAHSKSFTTRNLDSDKHERADINDQTENSSDEEEL